MPRIGMDTGKKVKYDTVSVVVSAIDVKGQKEKKKTARNVSEM